jgi:hypothetical protein
MQREKISMFTTIDCEVLKEKIAGYISRKPIYSNYFGIDFENVEYIEYLDTLLIRKSYETFSRIYFLSSNASQLIDLLKTLSSDDIINIPSKTQVSASLSEILSESGYLLFKTYVRLYNNHHEQRGEFVESFATTDDVDTMYTILYSNFCPYTDHLPSKAELTDMARNKQIIVNRDDNKEVTGLLAFSLAKTRCYFSVLINTAEGSGGLLLLLKGFDYITSKNITQSYLWVADTNHKMLNIYFSLGYQLDGLKDYTFVKQ